MAAAGRRRAAPATASRSTSARSRRRRGPSPARASRGTPAAPTTTTSDEIASPGGVQPSAARPRRGRRQAADRLTPRARTARSARRRPGTPASARAPSRPSRPLRSACTRTRGSPCAGHGARTTAPTSCSCGWPRATGVIGLRRGERHAAMERRGRDLGEYAITRVLAPGDRRPAAAIRSPAWPRRMDLALAGNPFTKAGLEMALWDALGRTLGPAGRGPARRPAPDRGADQDARSPATATCLVGYHRGDRAPRASGRSRSRSASVHGATSRASGWRASCAGQDDVPGRRLERWLDADRCA